MRRQSLAFDITSARSTLSAPRAPISRSFPGIHNPDHLSNVPLKRLNLKGGGIVEDYYSGITMSQSKVSSLIPSDYKFPSVLSTLLQWWSKSDSTLSLMLLCGGIGFIAQKIWSEFRVYFDLTTKGVDKVSWTEFVKYRLDGYFTSSPSLKPLLLLSLAFIIVLGSSIAQMVFMGENLGTAVWRAWTYIADPGR